MLSLTDKTIMITGATDGLGKLVAKHLAVAGATLILHGRNKGKGRRTVEEIQSLSGNKKIFYHNADFASLDEVQKLSKEILEHYQQLSVLINNAAIGGGPRGKQKRELSKDGYELRFAVNYLAHFLLTQNLLPLISKSAPSRIVLVASIGQSPLDFNDLMMEKHYESFEAYCRSKLAQIMYGLELAEKVKDNNVTVNSLHPASLMNTNMVYEFFGHTSSNVEDGARVVEYVAVGPETAGKTGVYFNQMKEGKANSQAYDQNARKMLWQISEELTKPFRS
jgi:NAD(P)-dependent dehydrogenase (short-subunit alcohol dehydrogenase family)